jgi:hypothetical protein
MKVSIIGESLFAFGNGQVKLFVSGALNIKEIGSLPGSHNFRMNLLIKFTIRIFHFLLIINAFHPE